MRRIAIVGLVVGILLSVGWPGDAPPMNEIRWGAQSADGSSGGIEFRGWSQAVTDEVLSFTGPALSIELWLEPPSAPGVGNQEILSLVDGQAHEARKVGAILSPGVRFGGRLLLGNSNTGWRAWQGTISSIAFHDRALLPDEIQEHATDSFDLTELTTRGKDGSLRTCS